MSNSRPSIYMDHSATTPVRAEVMEAMLPYFSQMYGNPSSIHGVGRSANVALSRARRTIAERIGARENEILFNSGGTEGDNAALRSIAMAQREVTGATRIITTPIEHKAVLYTAQDLAEHYGFSFTLLPVDRDGLVSVADVADALDDEGGEMGTGNDVALVSIMYANNEVGTVQPIAEIGALCRARGIPFHTDAVQAAGKLLLNVDELNVDALSTSAHKLYGPKGAGFLYLRRGTPFYPVQTGGSHEAGMRAGTENVPAIVGLANAFALAEDERTTESERLIALRDRLIDGILANVEGAHLTGSRSKRLPNHASFVVRGVEAEGMLIGLDLAGVAASSGSACNSAAQRPSHVLEAMGIPHEDAVGGLRLSLGLSNTQDDVDYVLEKLPQIVAQIQGSVPVML